MNQHHTFKRKLKTVIQTIENFQQTESGNEILISEYEKDNTSYILSDVDRDNKTCVINRESIVFDHTKVFSVLYAPVINFIPIDGNHGLLGGSSSCDFVFFNDINFCFVELKLNASSPEERAIRKNRIKATKQLKNTITYFDSLLNRDYFGLVLEAYVATPDMYPRKNTAWQSIRVNFLEDTGIDLFESREKIFST